MRLEALQAGRAAAALLVVLHHVAGQGAERGHPLPEPLAGALAHGYLGVDFFFVLSGFIILHASLGRPATPAAAQRFAWARLARIFVPYWPVGLAMAALFTLLPGLGGGDTAWSWLASLTLLPAPEGPALVVAWTLQHELAFYVLFGLGLACGRPLAAVGTWMAVLTVALIALGPAGPEAAGLRVLLLPINLEFGMGLLAALWFRSGRALPRPALALGILGPLALWVALGAERELSLLVGLSLAVAVAGLTGWERRGGRVPRAWVLLGDASYAIYLVHNPVLSVASRVLDGWVPLLLGGFAAAVAAGLLYHHLVERPLLARARRRAFAEPGLPA